MTRPRTVFGTALTSTLVVACNLLTGVGDLGVAPADASVVSDGATVDAPGTVDVADARPSIETGPPPTCPSAGNSCVKAPPAGWYGPFVIWEGPGGTAPECPEAMPRKQDHPTGAPVGAFACECRCRDPEGAVCKAFLQGYSDSVCTPPIEAADRPLENCQTPAADVGFRANLVLTGAGFCRPFAELKSAATPVFPTVIRACDRPQSWTSDGCASDELCVMDGVAPFERGTCIFSDDVDAICPAPWTEGRRVYEGVDDSRACKEGSCSCGTPTGTTCEGSIRNYTTKKDCTGSSTTITLPTGGGLSPCVPAPSTASQKVETASVAVKGACTAAGTPAPTGSVTGIGGSKICCLP